ncbi:hypothetical protein [Erysipelothrix anatis]|uniref:hypothetical protein n=1 Tax=Erysipelothrix anatis TaxID=2683713 RepID=UPI00135ACEDD|nr:hypothetical protein [Erysipelothrix anatis]
MLKEGKLNMFTEAPCISIWGHKFTKEEFDKLVEMHRTPTWDEVVKAWECVDDGYEEHKVEEYKNLIGVSNGDNYIFEISGDDFTYYYDPYTGRTTPKVHHAINLTIRYLEAQEIINGTI